MLKKKKIECEVKSFLEKEIGIYIFKVDEL